MTGEMSNADAVAPDVGDDGVVRDAQLPVFYGDFRAFGGDPDVGGHGEGRLGWAAEFIANIVTQARNTDKRTGPERGAGAFIHLRRMTKALLTP